MKTMIEYVVDNTKPFEAGDLLDYLHMRNNSLNDIEAYSKLLSSKPTVEMFVNLLLRPAYYEEWLNDEWIFSIEGVGKDCSDYYEADKKLIFQDWELVVKDLGYAEIYNSKLRATLYFHNENVRLDFGILNILDVQTIEELDRYFYNQL